MLLTLRLARTSADNTDDGSMVTYDVFHRHVTGEDGAGSVMDSFAIPITVVTGDIGAERRRHRRYLGSPQSAAC